MVEFPKVTRDAVLITGDAVLADCLDLDKDASFDQIRKAIYDSTEAGVRAEKVAEPEAEGIKLMAIVEGSDAVIGPVTLLYPFTDNRLESVIGGLEDDATDLWHEANCHAADCQDRDGCSGCSPSCRCYGSFGDHPDDHPGFDPMFLMM